MKRNKQAVSLITLVITIIVMTIIAGTIILTLSDTNIFNKANDAVDSHNVKEEITYIQSKIAFYALEKDKTFYEFLQQEFGENNVKDNLDDTYTITLESGNSYIVWENGKVQSSKGIYIEATGFPLMLKTGETVTGTLKATLVDITGEITWSIENNEIATISGTTGESITVTAVSQGKTKVTATCNGYTKEYIVKVSAEVPLGAYVEYGVSYKSFYQDKEYTSENGWRYFDLDEEGNKLLISTDVPVNLVCWKNEPVSWFDQDETLSLKERAVNGLLNNFCDIPYYLLQLEEGETYYPPIYNGKAYGLSFEGESLTSGKETTKTLGDCFIVKKYEDIIKNIRTLTFEEFKDRAGVENLEIGEYFSPGNLLHLGKLEGRDSKSFSFDYFLATQSVEKYLFLMYSNPSSTLASVEDSYIYGIGLRPVIVLDKSVELVFDEDRNLYTIQAE